MNNIQQPETNRTQQGHSNKPRPENKDDMDSRKEKEEGFKENDNKPTEKPKQSKDKAE